MGEGGRPVLQGPLREVRQAAFEAGLRAGPRRCGCARASAEAQRRHPAVAGLRRTRAAAGRWPAQPCGRSQVSALRRSRGRRPRLGGRGRRSRSWASPCPGPGCAVPLCAVRIAAPRSCFSVLVTSHGHSDRSPRRMRAPGERWSYSQTPMRRDYAQLVLEALDLIQEVEHSMADLLDDLRGCGLVGGQAQLRQPGSHVGASGRAVQECSCRQGRGCDTTSPRMPMAAVDSWTPRYPERGLMRSRYLCPNRTSSSAIASAPQKPIPRRAGRAGHLARGPGRRGGRRHAGTAIRS